MNSIKTFAEYSGENSFFLITFLFSLVPVWVPLVIAFTLKITAFSAILMIILIVASKSAQSHLVSGVNFYKCFIDSLIIFPIKITFYSITFYLLLILMLIMSLHSTWSDAGLTAVFAILCILYMLLFKDENPKKVWLVGRKELFYERIFYYVVINILWLYLVLSNDLIIFKYVAVFSIVAVEIQRFLKRHEGLF